MIMLVTGKISQVGGLTLAAADNRLKQYRDDQHRPFGGIPNPVLQTSLLLPTPVVSDTEPWKRLFTSMIEAEDLLSVNVGPVKSARLQSLPAHSYAAPGQTSVPFPSPAATWPQIMARGTCRSPSSFLRANDIQLRKRPVHAWTHSEAGREPNATVAANAAGVAQQHGTPSPMHLARKGHARRAYE
ncbi:hypothetical protein F5144DRAFT_630321 [Chaetomium tenue]|uniref:Uncharacterized protein n=1 Tax=Chaetomium tenue TaxID=1854479 RepID=A0ACB7PCC4_9PEZI|nr:hypothetical protein F5144DRAFT_630321 [Chaetomium globosum]